MEISHNNLPQAVAELDNKLDLILEHLTQDDPAQQEQDQFFTIDEAAAFLDLAKQTVYGLVSRNQIPFMKKTKRLYFSKLDLLEYLSEGRRS